MELGFLSCVAEVEAEYVWNNIRGQCQYVCSARPSATSYQLRTAAGYKSTAKSCSDVWSRDGDARDACPLWLLDCRHAAALCGGKAEDLSDTDAAGPQKGRNQEKWKI